MTYEVKPQPCSDCGSLPAFHEITCKFLPLRQDIMDSMRMQLRERAKLIERQDAMLDEKSRLLERLQAEKDDLAKPIRAREEELRARCDMFAKRAQDAELQVRELKSVVAMFHPFYCGENCEKDSHLEGCLLASAYLKDWTETRKPEGCYCNPEKPMYVCAPCCAAGFNRP